MGRLTIKVRDCRLLHSPGLPTLNPRIRVVVDDVYKFHTRSKKYTRTPKFNETFTVGNTHRLAIVELQAYHCLGPGSSVEDEHLLGSCRLSIERLLQGQKQTSQYFLAAKDGTGLAGAVTITLMTDIQGGMIPVLDKNEEKDCVQRLLRFLLRCDKSLLGDIDLLMSSIKGLSATARPRTSNTLLGVNPRQSLLSDSYATFWELMETLCAKYHCKEEPTYTLSLLVDGCTGLDRPTLYLPSYAVIAIRSPLQDFATPQRLFTPNPVWGGADSTTQFDVVDPETFALDIILYQVSTTLGWEEVALAQVSVSALTCNCASARQIFLFDRKPSFEPSIKGMVHLLLRPHNFGLSPTMQMKEYIDRFHERLNRFFYRYDHKRIPQVDMLLRSRLNGLDELMNELEIEYGREPGTMELWISVLEVSSLQLDAISELGERNVIVVVSMGDQVLRTDPKRVVVNSRTVFGETFVLDVARETDMIKLEVVQAGHENIVYGCIDFSCLWMQRGVRNNRTLYLVGNAGTNDAYLSGLIGVSLYSEQLGQAYSVDTHAIRMYAGRLRRYLHLRAPEKLHLVDIVVDTVFDIEGFLTDVAKEYGEEDASYAVYCSILGCRQLSNRLGFSMKAYVVVRMGIKRYETHVVRNSTEPDFFEFFEFVIDRLSENPITIVVMDQYDLSDDREVGRVTIPLNTIELEKQYHQWLPLQKPDNSGVAGIVGVKYTVRNLHLRDKRHIDGVKKKSLEDRSHHRLRSQNTSISYADRAGRRGNIFSRLGIWRNTFARVTANVFPRWRTSNNSSFVISDDGSGVSSDQESSVQTSMNIIDDSIHSVNEFCSASRLELTQTPSLTLFLTQKQGEILTEASSPLLTRTFSSNNQMQLYVRVLYCEDLDDKRRIPPSPYVMLSTLEKTHRTKTAFLTRSPKYNEMLVFPITDPARDYLSITVITETCYGKKCLGHCMLSMKNVQNRTPRTRRVPLVVMPHRPSAMERGTICLTLLGENFGLDHMPSIDAENRFSCLLRKMLASQAPQQLHRVQWYIGEYSLRENELLEKIFTMRNTTDEEEVAANVKLKVKSVTQLYLNDKLVVSGACFVKVKVGRKTLHRTRAVLAANGCFTIEEECCLTILHPTKRTLRITVNVDIDGKHNCGACELSLLDLHQNVVQERTHFIVKNPGFLTATPVGYITISLLSDNFGTLVSPMDKSDDSQYVRLRDYYYYYLREQLHMVDVKYSGIFNVEAYIQRLTERYGKEPGSYHLQVEVIRCRSPVVKSGSLYCIIQVGLSHFRTNIVQGSGEYVFLEHFDVLIGLPEKEEVKLIVKAVGERGATGVEVGRTALPLNNIVRGKETHLKLPLVYKAQARGASFLGFIEVSLFTRDFGALTEQQIDFVENSIYQRLEREILRRYPREMHRLPSIIAASQEQNEHVQNSAMIIASQSAEASSSSYVCVRLLGLHDFPGDKAYIKVKLGNGRTLLRTSTLAGEHLARINKEFTIDSSVDIENSIITLKLAVVKLLKSCVLCSCDFMIAQCPSGGVLRKWLRLFDSKGEPLGKLGIQVEVPASFERRSPLRNDQDLNQVEAIVDDVSSLLLKYSPKDLRKLDVVLDRADDLRTIHSQLRQLLAPQVRATVYCEVHRTKLLNPVKGHLTVETVVNEDVVRVLERKLVVRVASDTTSSTNRVFDYPPLRIDITSCGALLFRIYGEGGDDGEGELCCAALSLRALLTPELYDMGEAVTVMLVKIQRQRNNVQACLAGTLTFSLKAPAFEHYPRAVLLFDGGTPNVNSAFVRYYLDRICSLLTHYDANSLMDIHKVVYEVYVARRTWEVDLPNLLCSLIERWGPEVDSFPSPPFLTM
ncbi:hypothetical protein TraAM80_00009 [Trypanosoma rangeli]|uniref:C2 domain-containing protein n=1 Tax=Trypanosoma rangeli TaxID=5698 RepID=A0A3R7MCK1_TRYRA|nr:uncharacterized protein TraAM80_00009 [Trypanosoma rangeli]RNF12853.1 hypothetical protein TraAM80_00009 [Trypanosoma rangeli]|eukprot:RNF12853.1 hypothetical protein TraAM80_00009 [Trypanosoma rangeli]